MSKHGDLELALRELPLFPLHGAVLFPGSLLPLHVFEPRYRKLVEDVLDGHRALAVAHVPDPDADMAGAPPIAEIAGAGTIVEHWELPGGRCNIVLVGRARVRVQELSFAPPYRRAIATVLEADEAEDVPAIELASLHAAVSSFTQIVKNRDDSFKLRAPRDASAGQLIDSYAHQLILSPIERQRVLETVDVQKRARVVTEVLTVQRAMLAPDDQPLN